MNATMCGFAPYNIANVRSVGYDVVCNRPKSAAYRAPGSPISAFAVESVIDAVAARIGMDPLKFRLLNAAQDGNADGLGSEACARRLRRNGAGAARSSRL